MNPTFLRILRFLWLLIRIPLLYGVIFGAITGIVVGYKWAEILLGTICVLGMISLVFLVFYYLCIWVHKQWVLSAPKPPEDDSGKYENMPYVA